MQITPEINQVFGMEYFCSLSSWSLMSLNFQIRYCLVYEDFFHPLYCLFNPGWGNQPSNISIVIICFHVYLIYKIMCYIEKKINSQFLLVFILICLAQYFASTRCQKSVYYIDEEINDCINKSRLILYNMSATYKCNKVFILI